jgi:hypothetical protein
MEEWLSGVTQLIDKGTESDSLAPADSAGLKEIGNHLERLIREIQENQKAFGRLVETQNKEKGHDSD